MVDVLSQLSPSLFLLPLPAPCSPASRPLTPLFSRAPAPLSPSTVWYMIVAIQNTRFVLFYPCSRPFFYCAFLFFCKIKILKEQVEDMNVQVFIRLKMWFERLDRVMTNALFPVSLLKGVRAGILETRSWKTVVKWVVFCWW